MKKLVVVLWMVFLVSPAWAQAVVDDTVVSPDAVERERIRQTRANAQAQFAAQETQCYARFAVNDCLAEVRGHRREVLGDLRRQEISLNDAQRKRRAADQLLRSDERSTRSP